MHGTKDGWTALIIASMKGKSDIVKMLVDLGADVNAVNKCGMTALMHASRNDHLDVSRC
jgi:ankyrin repeat protein